MWLAWMIGYVTGRLPVADVDAAHPERILWPMIMVLGGAIGVLALFRVVWLVEQLSPHRAHRCTTLCGVVVGMGAVALYNFYGSFYGSSIEFYESLVFLVLPSVGTMHLVFMARHSLMPDALMRGEPHNKRTKRG
jgi:hypothetical protein